MDYEATPYEVVNLGNNRTVSLFEMVRALEKTLGVEAKLEQLPTQPGDVPQTWADVSKAKKLFAYQPGRELSSGLEKKKFWTWLGSAANV